VTFKGLVRPLPGVHSLSLLRQRLNFRGSAAYWEQNYSGGGTSGDGSYGDLAHTKADFLNAFIHDRGITSVTEFGCGDGHQLTLASYPRYVGLDVSGAAIELCASTFRDDPKKSFFLYEGNCFFDRARLFAADVAISLDVIYHLVEDRVFETYMAHLFGSADRYIVIYSSNASVHGTAPHVRHRCFTAWVAQNCPEWHLIQVDEGSGSWPGKADFYTYERVTESNG
jgi:hypothetical protein